MPRALPSSLGLAALAVLAVVAVPAASAGPSGAARAIESRKADLDVPALVKLLARGELALVESNDDGSAAQIVLFSAIAAPPERVFDVVTDVERYPQFMPSVVKNQIVKRQGDMIAYDWELDVPVFNLKGTRAMRSRRPELVEVRGIGGNFEGSRERWELYPLDGGKRTLAAFYRSVDVKTAGVMMKTMVSLEPSMEHGVNLAAGFVHVRDVRRHVEGLPLPKAHAAGGDVPKLRTLALGPDGLDLPALEGLLAHGQLALIESKDDGSLAQVALLTRVDAPKTALAEVVRAAARYPEFIPNLVSQKVAELDGGKRLRLDYELEVPLVNLDGVSEMTIGDDGAIDVVAVGGDIQRGRWRWELHALGDRVTVPVHYAYSDVTETSWFVKQLIEKQPLFEHGIVVAASTVALTAMKARAEGKR
ncbi:SRPBCC family protein [Myxococcota bacterium]|nr:SRPBCC family protein [Myxococcota bacterium]